MCQTSFGQFGFGSALYSNAWFTKPKYVVLSSLDTSIEHKLSGGPLDHSECKIAQFLKVLDQRYFQLTGGHLIFADIKAADAQSDPYMDHQLASEAANVEVPIY